VKKLPKADIISSLASSRRAFKPTPDQRGWVEAMIAYGMPEAEIRLLIKDPQTGEPIGLEKAKALVGDRIVGWILGRDGDLLDDRARMKLALFFAKARMGWTVANRPEHVGGPIDAEDARRRLHKKSARLTRGLKAGETGGASAG
jgi:hypothetical protein